MDRLYNRTGHAKEYLLIFPTTTLPYTFPTIRYPLPSLPYLILSLHTPLFLPLPLPFPSLHPYLTLPSPSLKHTSTWNPQSRLSYNLTHKT